MTLQPGEVLRTSQRDSLASLLDRQQDLATRGQLLGAGITDMTVYRNIRNGKWQRILPGIYRLGGSPLTEEARRIAAALFAGPDAQLTGLMALHWHGFRHAPSTEKVHVLVPHRVHRKSSGFVVVQRTLALDEDARQTDLYVVTSPSRAVVDACRFLTDITAIRAVVAEAVHRSFTTAHSLDAEIRRAARSRTSLVRRALTEVIDGVRSAPEAELRTLTLSSRILPTILWNPVLSTLDGTPLPTPDGWLPDVGIALEVDSQEHHSSPDDWRRTLSRHNVLSQYGIIVLHFTPAEIRREPKRVLRVIEQAYHARLAEQPIVDVLTGAPS
jgi:hypothetical protein